MSSLIPLIELASSRNLDLFFRIGQGYLARSAEGLHRQAGWGLSPHGVLARAEARIICTMPPRSRDARLHAWPGGPQPARRLR